jgi:hypothetical protein
MRFVEMDLHLHVLDLKIQNQKVMVYFDANGPRRVPHEVYKDGYRGLKRLKNKRLRMISREEKGKTL